MAVEWKYEPLPKQLIFHEAREKFRCYAGGYGSAKTTAGVFEVLQIALTWGRNLILVTRSTYPELRDTTMKELLQFPVLYDGKEYEFGSSPLIKSFNKADHHLTLINATEIIFRPLDKLDKIKSLNLGAFLMDEATEFSEETFLALTGRLRRVPVCSTCGKRPYMVRGENGKRVQPLVCKKCNRYVIQHYGLLTTNPEGHDWVWKRFVAGAEKLQEWEHDTHIGKLKTFEAKRSDYHIITATSEENPYLPENYVPDMLKNYPEEWIKRYVYGSFETFSGNIYHEFRDEKPLVVPKFPIPPTWYRFVALDYGYRNPTAVLWFAVSPQGIAYVYDEYYATGKLVSESAEIIKAKNGNTKIQMYLGDPSMQNKNGVAGRSVLDEFADCGIVIQKANNSVSAGINRVKERFKAGSLVIFNNCQNLRTELQTYKWKDLKPGATQDGPEKPVKKNDHACDALRYGTVYLYDTPEVTARGYAFDYSTKEQEEPCSWMAA